MTTRTQQRAYIRRWLDRYPFTGISPQANADLRALEAQKLAQFGLGRSLVRHEVEQLVCWKFARAAYRNRALKGIQERQWRQAAACIGKAAQTLNDPDPNLPLDALLGIPGWGPAMSSVVLAVMKPDRFTIGDRRSLASLRRLGLMPSGPTTFQRSDWVPYLTACTDLVTLTGRTLREVDQALWVANGGH